MKNNRRWFLVVLMLSLLLAACGSNTAPGDNNGGQDNGFNFSEEELEENQPEEAGMEFGENEEEDPDGDPEIDDEQDFQFGEADDACLEGTWLLDIETFGRGLELTFNEKLTNGSFEVTPVMGELRFIFEGDFVEMRTDLPLFFKIDFTASGMLLSEMEIEVSASGTAHWIAADSHIIFYGQDIHAEGSGDWQSQLIGGAASSTGNSGVVSLDLEMSDLFVNSDVIDLSSLGLDVPIGLEHTAQVYDCKETKLVLFTDTGNYNDQWFTRE
ncbi:MAG: hypothetical protein ABFS17_05690 [Chloroflexota bacterium]